MSSFSLLVFWAIFCFLTFGMEKHPSLACLDEEKVGLLKLKEAFEHVDNYRARLSSWREGSKNCCNWERVECDSSSKRVVQFSLDFLVEFLPGYRYWSLDLSLFSPFQELKNLSLRWNSLGGFIGELRSSNLERLDLSFNKLTDVPPFFLSANMSLKYLDLRDNKLTNAPPFFSRANMSLKGLYLGDNYLTSLSRVGGLTNLSVLEELDLSWNRINDSILEGFIGELRSSNLEYLDLRGNKLTDVPSFFWRANMSLKYLDLGNNYLTSQSRFGGFIGELRSSNLEHLDLRGNMLTDVPPFFSRANMSLKYLNLGDNYLTSQSRFGGLTNFSVLEELYLHGNQINGSIPEGLCMLRNLEWLGLSNNYLSGVIPLCLSNLTSLKSLYLSWNSLVGNIPSKLFPNLKSLEQVGLSGNHFEGLFSFGTLSSNSKLEDFELDCNNAGVVVDTENPPWTPLFQLKYLNLSHCKLNEPTGVIPSFLVNQYNLTYLDLSYNNLSGKIPSWLIRNNTNLWSLLLRGNLFTGPILLYPDLRNLNLVSLDISSNQIQDKLPDLIGSILPNIRMLNMSANMFYGSIPPSMGDMKDLSWLDLSSNNFSGGIPEHLAVGCTSLMLLKLSNNFLQGPLFPAKWNLTELESLLLDNNHFSGEISSSLRNSIQLRFLNLRNNSISGEIPDWLGGFSRLISLVLSDNSFEGHIPDSFWKLQQLEYLDMSHNKIIGLISSCVNLTSLKFLHLQRNSLTGPLPHAFSKSLSLVTLDVRDNKFYGELPDWISSLSSLRFLLMKNNSFDGSIPSDICHLKNISVLDLSSNKFDGLIPSCLYQTPFGSREINYTSPIEIEAFEIIFYLSLNYGPPTSQEDEIWFMSKSRLENYRRGPLHYMFGMDLSQNELTGHIPDEFGNLTNIQTLNLSHNHLTDSIPTTLSNLKRIESLDLSYNRLSGQIPSELTQLNFMSTFLVTHNNLSGRLPDMKGQFATFNERNYEGNPLLCGPPLARSCVRSGQLPPSKSAEEEEDEEGEEESFRHTFMMAFLVSYFPTFLGTISFIYFMVRWRERKLIKKARRRRISHPRMP